MPRALTVMRAVDALWCSLNRSDTPAVDVIGDDASLTLACLTDLAYWRYGREIDYVAIPSGYRVALGDPVRR